ncbi:NAD(P)-binding protein [Hypoxylon sp. FL0890]|nr:NAD(P)-binding protein [Hypoxylon sp. FL0890]
MDVTGYAFVFGGGSGISRATCLTFAKQGARGLMVADINLESATKVANESKDVATHPDFRAEAVQVDVTLPDAVQHATEAMIKAFGRIDYCVNGAGVAGNSGDVADYDVDQFQRVMDVNVRGSFLVLKTVSKAMASQDPLPIDPNVPARGTSRGAIVNIGSVAGTTAFPHHIGYVTSKHAVIGLTRAAAFDNIKREIRVNSVCPGWVDTPLLQDVFAKAPPVKGMALNSQPTGRLALPEEIADVIVFLCSSRSNWINGCNYTVDGAMTLSPFAHLAGGASAKGES